MSKHEPFCYQFVAETDMQADCFCDLIASVQRAVLDDLRVAVEALPHANDDCSSKWHTEACWYCDGPPESDGHEPCDCPRGAVLALLDAVGDHKSS